MNYSEKREKQIQQDYARGTTHTIEGKMHQQRLKQDQYRPKPASVAPRIPSAPLHMSTTSLPLGRSPRNPLPSKAVGTQAEPAGSSWVSDFVEKHYPKKAPLWAYFALAFVGCLVGAVIGATNGGSMVEGSFLGAVLGFIAIPVVAIGFQLALRVLAVAAILYIFWVIITHLAK